MHALHTARRPHRHLVESRPFGYQRVLGKRQPDVVEDAECVAGKLRCVGGVPEQLALVASLIGFPQSKQAPD